MAGKETRGAAEAEPALFTGRTYALTPRSPDELETPPARDFIAWVRAIGAIPVTVAPDEHDRIAAFTSHLPQLLSTALASTLTRAAGDLRIAGPGLADALRLAASSYEVWGDILDTNAAAIDAALARFIAQLETIRARLGAPGALKTEFEQANQLAARLRRSR
jgi:prephenate dehydrogenase